MHFHLFAATLGNEFVSIRVLVKAKFSISREEYKFGGPQSRT
jgi:hypothetical protein